MSVEELILERFVKNKLTLSLAESCTGGSLAARLTGVPGASQYFLGSVVAYSNALKTKFLGVPEALIRQKGAVSAEVVEAMLQGVLTASGSDVAVAVSGIAGPDGGSLEKPVGTIWAGIGTKTGMPKIWTFKGKGNRKEIIQDAVNTILNELLTY